MTKTSKFLSRACAARFQSLVIVAMLAMISRCALALPNQEEPIQRDWGYGEYTDVVTGASYPAASLASRSTSAAQAKASIGLGYFSVGNYSKRPMEVTLSWDSSRLWNRSVTNCKPNGCEIQIRFGSGKAMMFNAIQDKNSPTLMVEDGRAFIDEAVRQNGAIEVRIQTLQDGLLIFQFTTENRLRLDRLKR